MSTRVAERLDDWNSRSFTGGYHELHELADEEFSGVIRAEGAELYMTSGTVVGVQRGSIEDLEGASGTLYEAPSPALPLLAVMQAEDVDVRAQYYSEDTPMEEVDRTLSDGGFTGYIELSENVLSGDYYLVYHGGRSMAVAFVGNSSKLITEDEAFETANDEVGIYKVRQVDVDPIEIPDPSGEQGGGGATGGRSGQAEAAAAGAGGSGAAAPSEEAETRTADAGSETQAGDAAAAGSSSSTEAASSRETTTGERDAGTPDAGEGSTGPPGGGDASSSTASETATNAESSAAAETSEEDRSAGPDAEPESGPTGEPGDRPRQSTEGSADRARSDDARTSDASSAPRENRDRSGTGTADASTGTRQGSSTGGPDRGGTSSDRSGTRNDRAGGRSPQGPGTAAPGGTVGRGAPTGGSGGGATDLETRAIPSLDPSRTKTPRPETGPTGGSRAESAGAERQSGGTGSSRGAQQPGRGASADQRAPSERQGGGSGRPPGEQSAREEGTRGADAAGAGQRGTADAGSGPGGRQPEGDRADPDEAGEAGAEAPARESEPVGVPQEEFDELQAELEEREAAVEQLESEVDRVTTERDDLEEQLEAARRERDELAEQVERLESQLATLEEELGAAPDAERRMTAREALDGTDIFVRYLRKDDATLAKAHDGSVRREDVTSNLRLEKHTQFDASNVAVGGKSYHEFLEARPEFQFIRWTVEELLFEVRDTGHADALKVLYDALPQVDRAELNGVIEATFMDDGQETRTQESFDVVLRDRMGNPLLVANLNDSRQGATESMMTDLITAAERVGQSSETFAGAFLVTRSFFEPDALETAEEATRSGFLSRDKRRSFVNISRKQGFHLCLVEARNQNFHLAVPEL